MDEFWLVAVSAHESNSFYATLTEGAVFQVIHIKADCKVLL